MAKRRTAILCSLLPVKYCKAEPKEPVETTRKSISKPSLVLTDDLVSPLATTFTTSSNVTKVFIIFSIKYLSDASSMATKISASPIVSLRRRVLPAMDIFFTPPIFLIRCSIFLIKGKISRNKKRPLDCLKNSMDSKILSSVFWPNPKSGAILPAFAAFSKPVKFLIPNSS